MYDLKMSFGYREIHVNINNHRYSKWSVGKHLGTYNSSWDSAHFFFKSSGPLNCAFTPFKTKQITLWYFYVYVMGHPGVASLSCFSGYYLGALISINMCKSVFCYSGCILFIYYIEKHHNNQHGHIYLKKNTRTHVHTPLNVEANYIECWFCKVIP